MLEVPGGGPAAKRKPKGHLTLIPEETLPITYRFSIAVVGESAEEFAAMAVNSEFAEVYKPKRPAANPAGGTESAHLHAEDAEDRLVMFCPPGAGSKELARLRFDPSSVKEALSDFRSRMAEILHGPISCRPYTIVLAFGADAEQETLIKEFVEQQKQNMLLASEFYKEDSEDTVSDALLSLCEEGVKYQRSRSTVGGSSMMVDSKAKKGCCAVQ